MSLPLVSLRNKSYKGAAAADQEMYTTDLLPQARVSAESGYSEGSIIVTYKKGVMF
jgi:hypothetical protein